jgi:hypothetical protein
VVLPLAPILTFLRGLIGDEAGEFLPNFDLKNMITSNTKDFPWKKKTQIRQIL